MGSDAASLWEVMQLPSGKWCSFPVGSDAASHWEVMKLPGGLGPGEGWVWGRVGSGGAAPRNFWSTSVQTTRKSNLALPGRRFNRILTDSYNKFSRLTLKKWGNKN